MQQNFILLMDARENQEYALEYLPMIANGIIYADFDDKMLAYLIAKSWCHQLSSKPANPVDQINLGIFQSDAGILADWLLEYKSMIMGIFEALNSNLIYIYRSSDFAREVTIIYHRTLACTALLYAEKGDRSFYQLLEEKRAQPSLAPWEDFLRLDPNAKIAF